MRFGYCKAKRQSRRSCVVRSQKERALPPCGFDDGICTQRFGEQALAAVLNMKSGSARCTGCVRSYSSQTNKQQQEAPGRSLLLLVAVFSLPERISSRRHSWGYSSVSAISIQRLRRRISTTASAAISMGSTTVQPHRTKLVLSPVLGTPPRGTPYSST